MYKLHQYIKAKQPLLKCFFKSITFSCCCHVHYFLLLLAVVACSSSRPNSASQTEYVGPAPIIPTTLPPLNFFSRSLPGRVEKRESRKLTREQRTNESFFFLLLHTAQKFWAYSTATYAKLWVQYSTHICSFSLLFAQTLMESKRQKA